MVTRNVLVQGGASAVFWDHHMISEQYGNNNVPDLLQKNSQLLNTDAAGRPLNSSRAFDINSTSNRIYLSADTGLAASLGQAPHPGNHLSSYLNGSIGHQLDLIEQHPTFEAAQAAYRAGDNVALRPLLLEINTRRARC
jgi:hypothetical protein